MGKKKVVYIFALVLVFLTFAWCAFRKFSCNENYLSVLPSDVIALSRIHVDELVKAKENSPSLFTTFFLQRFSNKSGIKFSSPLYAFMDAERRLGVVGAVSNASTLKSFLTKNHFKIERNNDFNMATWNYLHLVFDDEKFFAIFKLSSSDTGIEDYMVKSMMQSEQASCALQSAIDTLDGQFTLVAHANALPQSMTDMMEVILPKDTHPKDITITSSLSLHEKKIRLEGKISSDKTEINKLLDRIDNTFRPVGKYVSFDAINPSIASVIHLNVEGKEFLQFARSIPDVRLALLALNMCIDADMMISSVNGPVSIYNAKESFGTGNMILSASLENTDFLRNIDDWDDNMTSGTIGYEKLSDKEFRIEAFEKNFWFSIQNQSLHLASPNRINTLAGLAVSAQNSNGKETQNIMVMQVKLDAVKEMLIPPLQDYLKQDKTILLQFSDSRHFNIQMQ